MSVKYKLVAGYCVLILILVASSLISAFSSGRQEAEVNELMTEDMPVMTTTYGIRTLGLNFRRSEKDILLNIGDRNKQEGYLKQLKSDAETLLKKARELSADVAADRELGDSDKRNAQAIVDNFSSYYVFAGAYLEDLIAGRKGDITAQQANTAISARKDEFHNFEKALSVIQEAARKMVADKAVTMNGISSSLRTTQLASLFGGLAVGILSAVVTILSISRPMKRILGYSATVSSGDLDARLNHQGSDEFAELGGNIERMVEALKAKIGEAERMTREAAEEAARARKATEEAEAATRMAEQARAEGMSEAARNIEQVVDVVASATRHLLERVEQASQGARDQARRVEETMAAMREMNATVLDVARSASQAADSTDRAKSDALTGSEVLCEVVESIRRVQTQAQSLKGDMGELGVQAEGIGRVMNVISDIADQTNLLALNAAIEAARAGDAGRGFAVVADEVRKLAEKTMSATREVGDAIQGIQQGTHKNIVNVEAAVDTIGKATELAERSGRALEGILALVQQAADQVRSIATASEEQSAASEQINRSIEEINTISSGTTDNMRQSSGEVEELSRQARVLSDLVLAMDSGGR